MCSGDWLMRAGFGRGEGPHRPEGITGDVSCELLWVCPEDRAGIVTKRVDLEQVRPVRSRRSGGIRGGFAEGCRFDQHNRMALGLLGVRGDPDRAGPVGIEVSHAWDIRSGVKNQWVTEAN